MNILVTGAGGFIGRRLISLLCSQHYHVVALHNRLPEAPIGHGERIIVSELAGLKKEDMAALFDGKPFSVVHLAWHSPRERQYAQAATHVAQMAHLLELIEGRAERVISLGSADEYGTREGCLTPGMQAEGILSPYGWSKHCARELLVSWAKTTGTSCFLLRPFTVYGEEQKGNMLLPYAIKQAQSGQEAKFSDGLQKRDFIHVDDVISAIHLALKASSKDFQEINLGQGEAIEVKAVLLEIARSLQAEPLFHLGAIARRVDEPMVRYADIQSARALLSWEPRITMTEGLKRIIAYENSKLRKDEPVKKSIKHA